MNADVIFTMSWILKLHVICALVALFLGPIALFYSKRSRTHKCIGYVWMIGMSITAITSFWITEIKPGHFSAVHVLSVFALGSIVHAFVAIRNGNIKAHRATLRNLYIFGTFGAFTVNFLPGRTLPSAFLNGGTWTSFIVAAMILCSLAFLLYRTNHKPIFRT